MNVKVEVFLKSPELMAGLIAVAEAVEELKKIVERGSVGQAPEVLGNGTVGQVSVISKNDTDGQVPQVQKSKIVGQATQISKHGTDGQVSLEEVRKLLAKKSREGKMDKVKELIFKYGGKKLTEVDCKYFGELLKEGELI